MTHDAESPPLAATVSRLMRGLNHDLKNPLGAAEGYLELLMEGMLGELDAEQKKTVGRVRGLLGEALSIIDDVVTYARASIGELDTRVVPTDMASLVRMAATDLKRRGPDRDVTVEVDAPERLPDLETDPDRISQILRHLLTNAVEHSPDGGTVQVRVSDEGTGDSRRVRIEVEDRGDGIARDELDRLFLAFEKGQNGGGGPGFGLPLSRALADLLGGRLSVESAEGEGSTFALELGELERPASAPADPER